MAPDAFEASIAWYNAEVAKLAAKHAENNKAALQQTRTALRGQWGSNYDANVNVVDTAFRSLPKSLKQAFKTARTQDGTLIGAMPELAQLLHQLGRNSSPVNDAADDAKVEEQARLYMRTDFDRYIREKWDEKLTRIIQKRGGTRAAPTLRRPTPGRRPAGSSRSRSIPTRISPLSHAKSLPSASASPCALQTRPTAPWSPSCRSGCSDHRHRAQALPHMLVHQLPRRQGEPIPAPLGRRPHGRSTRPMEGPQDAARRAG